MKYSLSISLICLICIGCKSTNNISDPLPSYWQMKIYEKNVNDINYQIKLKLDEIEEELYKIDLEMDRLKEPEWHKNVHSIYSNIQLIRNKKIEPFVTLVEDDS